jgi:hypothetical protein
MGTHNRRNNMSYDKDIAEPLRAMEEATWLLKPDYEAYKGLLQEYRENRADCFTILVNIVGQSDQDVSSSWMAALQLGAVKLDQIKEALPLAGSENNLGLTEWSDRERRIYDVLKAEDFLRARQSLIAKKEELIQAAEALQELSDQFFNETDSRNAELDEAAAASREKLYALTRKGTIVAGAASAVTTGTLQEVMTLLTVVLAGTQDVLSGVDKKRQALRAKQQTNELLEKIAEAFGDLTKEDQEEKIRNIVSELNIDGVAGSDDFNELLANLVDTFRKVHLEPAEAAAKRFGELVRKGIGDESEEKRERIYKLKSLAAQSEIIDSTEQEIESDLKAFEDVMAEMLREGEEKQEITRILNEIRENLRTLKDEDQGDFIEYQGEVETLAQLLQFP